MRYLLCLLTTLALGSVAARASAGCPNPCEMTVTMPAVTPPLACADIKVTAQDCDCAVELKVVNGCQAPIEASGFDFDGCWDGTSWKPCAAIPPSQYGVVETPLGVTGHQDYSYELIADDGPHQVTFGSDVSSFNDGCVCTVPGARASVGAGWVWFALGAAAWGSRRRRATAPAGAPTARPCCPRGR